MNGNTSNRKIRALVVDDSPLMSTQITGILNSDPDIEVIGQAADGVEALEMVGTLNPDIVTLDVEMPRMNGLTALKHIMVKHAVPTVMISALTQEGSKLAFDAFKYGAIDVIAKPSKREEESLEGQRSDILNKVKRAAEIRTGKSRYVRVAALDAEAQGNGKEAPDSSTRFIGMGVGTGGYYSLLRIVPSLPADFQGVLVAVILVAPRYVNLFASYLEAHSSIPVKNVTGVTSPEKGICYLCSGGQGLVVGGDGASLVKFAGRENSSGPNGGGAIDLMFKSLARTVGNRAVGVVMSGSGRDGAEGIAEIRKSGGIGIVQDITNCMDPSMPLAVLERSSVEKMLPDFHMAEYFTNLVVR